MILVTGSSGFIGSSIAEKLQNKGLIGLDINPSYSLKNHEIKADITDRNFIEKLKEKLKIVSEIDSIVHTAALISSSYCYTHPDEAFRVNFIGTLNLLEFARKYDVSRFIYISSGGIYGKTDPGEIIDERKLPDPQDVYSTTKLISEIALKEYSKSYSITAASLRITAPYGPRMNGSKFPFQIPDGINRHPLIFAIKCVLSQDIIMPVGGEHTINYTYIDDIVDAVALSLEASFKGFEVFNIAGGRNYSIRELGEAVKDLCPKLKVSIGPGDLTKGYDENDPMLSKLSIKQGLFDISKAEKILGFKPKYSLKDGMKELILYIRKQMPVKD
ncbi:MAG: NAD(P)-dependent oxidoreductase [Caldisphaera sp.]